MKKITKQQWWGKNHLSSFSSLVRTMVPISGNPARVCYEMNQQKTFINECRIKDRLKHKYMNTNMWMIPHKNMNTHK